MNDNVLQLLNTQHANPNMKGWHTLMSEGDDTEANACPITHWILYFRNHPIYIRKVMVWIYSSFRHAVIPEKKYPALKYALNKLHDETVLRLKKNLCRKCSRDKKFSILKIYRDKDYCHVGSRILKEV